MCTNSRLHEGIRSSNVYLLTWGQRLNQCKGESKRQRHTEMKREREGNCKSKISLNAWQQGLRRGVQMSHIPSGRPISYVHTFCPQSAPELTGSSWSSVYILLLGYSSALLSMHPSPLTLTTETSHSRNIG